VANISGNTVANTTAGIFMQDSHELTISGNTLYNNTIQIIIRHAQADQAIRNNDIYNNIAVSKSDSQNVVVMSSIASGITGFGSFHDNKYARVSPYSLFFRTALLNENNSGSFSLWQSQYKQDWNSNQLAVTFAPYTVSQLVGANMYTKGNLTLPFQQTPVGSRTIVNAPVGAVLTNSWYVAKFTLHAPDALRTLLVYLQKYQPPYTHFTPVISIPSVYPATTQTIVFNTTGGDPNSSIVFQMNVSDPRVFIDNITLYKAVVVPNDINQMVFFQYNASKIAKAFPLSAIYQDVSGVTYQSSVTIQPYSSVVLFKK
jgi:parallel beta-helix repeat protein